ncbi:MAG: DNA/RNA non-specific endonuclease, partial [Lachnospiraceae bacterium]|nr:DNA/RNA non-specific endonuclease [Lachnospiraceae bacterium]
NRCHLIGFQLSGENANEKNLITGTRYLNVDGMLPFENMIADYVKETENHVMYRVTPVFEGDNLVASGVLLEAQSVEDQGEDLQFCVYVYNVQPGITIDYATGASSSGEQSSETASRSRTEEQNPESESRPQAEEPQPELEAAQESAPQGTDYILNTSTKKFHYPTCGSVKQMKESNKQAYTGSRDEVIAQGYDPCKKCNP